MGVIDLENTNGESHGVPIRVTDVENTNWENHHGIPTVSSTVEMNGQTSVDSSSVNTSQNAVDKGHRIGRMTSCNSQQSQTRTTTTTTTNRRHVRQRKSSRWSIMQLTVS